MEFSNTFTAENECPRIVMERLQSDFATLTESLHNGSDCGIHVDEYIKLTREYLQKMEKLKMEMDNNNNSKNKNESINKNNTNINIDEKNNETNKQLFSPEVETCLEYERMEENEESAISLICNDDSSNQDNHLETSANCNNDRSVHEDNCNNNKNYNTKDTREHDNKPNVESIDNLYRNNEITEMHCNLESDKVGNTSGNKENNMQKDIVCQTPTNNYSKNTKRTYLDAVLRRKRASPKRVPLTRLASGNSNELEATRHASALRSEERQRRAEERRLEHINEIKLKSEVAEQRSSRARARREAVEEKHRVEVENRMEGGLRRVAAAREQTVARAHRAHSRVDEVRFTNELKQQTKMLLFDRKMSEIENIQEQQRELRERVIHEHEEAVAAAAERRRFLSQERIERQQQREIQRQETLRRAEEQRQKDLELKQQRLEEWEKKVHQHHIDANAEAEALSWKVENKLQVSAQLRDEQRQEMKNKLEKEEQRQRNAHMRREHKKIKDFELNPNLHKNSIRGNNTDVARKQTVHGTESRQNMQQISSDESDKAKHSTIEHCTVIINYKEDELIVQRINKFAAAALRQSVTFVDNYRKECELSPKDLNRSKLRPFFSRLTTSLNNHNWNQCNQSLNGIIGLNELNELDYEYIRYNNAMELLCKVAVESSKNKAINTVELTCRLLYVFFTNKEHGRANVEYFVKSGCDIQIELCIREFVKSVANSNIKATYSTNKNVSNVTSYSTYDNSCTDKECEREHFFFDCTTVCILLQLLTTTLVEVLSYCKANNSKLHAVRDEFLMNMENFNFYEVCISIVQIHLIEEEQIRLSYCALEMLYVFINALSKRKTKATSKAFFTTLCINLLSLLQFIVNSKAVDSNDEKIKIKLLKEECERKANNVKSVKNQFSCSLMWVIYLAFRTLNALARWQLVEMQSIFHDTEEKNWFISVNGTLSTNRNENSDTSKHKKLFTTTNKEQHEETLTATDETRKEGVITMVDEHEICFTRMELFNVLNQTFAYFANNSEYFETINYESTQATKTTSQEYFCVPFSTNPHFCSNSFNEALRFGVTYESIPMLSDIMKPTDSFNGNTDYKKKSGEHDFVIGGKRYPLRATLHEVLLLIGYISLDDDEIQEIFSWGETHSLISLIINVIPGNYFSSARHILFPTLLSICVNNIRNLTLIKSEIDINHLFTFMKEEFNVLSKKARVYANTHSKLLEQFRLQNGGKETLVINIKNKNWAELAGDEDDFDSVSSVTQQSSFAVASLDNTTSIEKVTPNKITDQNYGTKPNDEKEKLCKSFRISNLAETDFYRIDLRIPIVYWPLILQQLRETLSATNEKEI